MGQHTTTYVAVAASEKISLATAEVRISYLAIGALSHSLLIR
jgi:hypothetical protein